MNEIKLQLGGKEQTFKLGIGYLRYLDENHGLKLADIDNILVGGDTVKLPILVFASMKYTAFRNSETFELNQYNVDDMIDEVGGLNSQFMVDFVTAFLKSIQIQNPDVGQGKQEPQKKVAKK